MAIFDFWRGAPETREAGEKVGTKLDPSLENRKKKLLRHGRHTVHCTTLAISRSFRHVSLSLSPAASSSPNRDIQPAEAILAKSGQSSPLPSRRWGGAPSPQMSCPAVTGTWPNVSLQKCVPWPPPRPTAAVSRGSAKVPPVTAP